MGEKRNFKGFLIAAILALIVLAAIGMFLFSKRRQFDAEISPERLSDGSEYKFDKLNWGISAAEAAKLLPFDIVKDTYRNEYEGAGGTVFYTATNSFTLDGQEATLTFEFEDDGLAIVQYSFRLDEASAYEQWFVALTEELLGLYGKESRSVENTGSPFCSKGYVWETDATMLQITLITGESYNPSALIGVARKP
ncbi:MAG: hypothetical protein K2P39_07720 [Lachnospiraceae bacterium]|nr:hypothetical protein [Lachnospiraceae bacterium]